MSLEEIPNKIKIAKIYEPQVQNRQVYDRLFKQFMVSYKKTQPIFHALNK
jgi:hypothetical protein